MKRVPISFLLFAALGCGNGAGAALENDAAPALDSLHARISALHRERDPAAYAALHSDSVVFDWPMVAPVRGRSALEVLMRDNWRTREQLDLVVTPVARRVSASQATEVLAFQETWTDASGGRVTERGRFLLMLSRASDGRWYIDRLFGFADSVGVLPRNRNSVPRAGTNR